MQQRKYKITDELKQGEARALFGKHQRACVDGITADLVRFHARPDYIADSVDSFLTDIGTEMDENEKIHLGFTFRYVSAVLVPCLISCH